MDQAKQNEKDPVITTDEDGKAEAVENEKGDGADDNSEDSQNSSENEDAMDDGETPNEEEDDVPSEPQKKEVTAPSSSPKSAPPKTSLSRVKAKPASPSPSTEDKVTKRVRFQDDATGIKKKEEPKPAVKVVQRKKLAPVASPSTGWRDYLLVVAAGIVIVGVLKLIFTPPPTIIVTPPISENHNPNSDSYRSSSHPSHRAAGRDETQNNPPRNLLKTPPGYKGMREYPTQHDSQRYSQSGYYMNEEEEGDGSIENQGHRSKLASDEDLSATKNYFLINRDSMKRIHRYEFIRNATDFIRGYARMKAVCDELVNALGLRSLVQHHSGQGENLTPRFDNHLYLPSGSAYSPNFCLNVPGDVLFQYDFDPTIKLAPAEFDAHRRFGTTWREMTSDGTIVTNSISPGQLFASSSLHSPTLMGYFLQHFYARDLQTLGNKTNTSLVLNLVPYNVFMDGIDAIPQTTEKPLCICGAHMNMPRHIVVYADRNTPKGRLYIEPTIISKHDSAIISTATMPWTRSPFDRNDATAYQRAEEILRNELKLSSITSSNNVVVDSMQLVSGTSGLKRVLRYEGGRQVSPLSGSEANCLCYCEALIYEMRRAADEMIRTSPQDTLLNNTPSPSPVNKPV